MSDTLMRYIYCFIVWLISSLVFLSAARANTFINMWHDVLVEEGVVSNNCTDSFGDWGRKVELTVQSSQVSGSGVTHSNFPVLLGAGVLTEAVDSDEANRANADGSDLRFFEDTNCLTELASETVAFSQTSDPANAVVEVWIKRDIQSDSDVSIFMLYNNAGATAYGRSDTYGSEAVWAGYENVYHMDDATTSLIGDSTSNQYTGTKASADNPIESTVGPVGNSQDFSLDYITASANTPSVLNADFTLSFWINADSFTAESSNNRHVLSYQDGVGTGHSLAYVKSADGKMYSFLRGVEVGGNDVLSAGASNYYYFSLVYDADGDTLTIYKDGNAGDQSSLAAGSDETGTGDLVIGAIKSTAAGRFDGDIDELWIDTVEHTQAWTATAWANQLNPNTFISEGTPGAN